MTTLDIILMLSLSINVLLALDAVRRELAAGGGE
jgi:hypothetical protein